MGNTRKKLSWKNEAVILQRKVEDLEKEIQQLKTPNSDDKTQISEDTGVQNLTDDTTPKSSEKPVESGVLSSKIKPQTLQTKADMEEEKFKYRCTCGHLFNEMGESCNECGNEFIKSEEKEDDDTEDDTEDEE